MSDEIDKLPQGWAMTTIGEVALINPGVDTSELSDSTQISFVPMAAVGAGTGKIDPSELRNLERVKRGYTAFRENDVLFAKITPCMENGKFAVARGLSSRIGFGSTEFHVLRSEVGIDPKLLYYYLARGIFRQAARQAMTGTAGQLRVPGNFLTNASYPLPPSPEQQRIVAAIEQLFTRLDVVVASLRRDKTRLKQARAAVLRDAVEGRLTEKWRAEHSAVETGSELLQRILAEKRAKWEAEQVAKGKDLQKMHYVEPVEIDVSKLGVLPEGWCWATVSSLLSEPPCNGISIKGSDTPPGFPALKLSAMSDFGFDYDDRRYILISDDIAESLAIQEGDFFVSRGNGSLHLIGRGTIAQKPPECIVFPDTIIRLRLVNMGMLRYFIACIWSSNFVRKQIEAKARTTAGIYKISQADVKSFILPLPPLTEQQQIVAEVERRLSIITYSEVIIEANLKRAERLRQSILKKAFSGQLVPQDPHDEPASALLERIRAQRMQGRKNAEATVQDTLQHIPRGKRRYEGRMGTRDNGRVADKGNASVSLIISQPVLEESVHQTGLWGEEI